MSQRFDEAWRQAQAVAASVTREGFDVVLVRDLLGRAMIVVDDSVGPSYAPDAATVVAERLRDACAPFVAADPVLATRDLFTPEALIPPLDASVIEERDAAIGRGRLSVVERGIVGREWRRVTSSPTSNRVTLYGFKGGVGRSTATTVLAYHLASEGRCVLVVDLDLESPGVSSILAGNDGLPDYGIVDYLVESAVGNVADGLDCVVRSVRLTLPGNGEVWIAPAGGRPRDEYSYLPKLNRAYLDYQEMSPLPGSPTSDGSASFAGRLRAAVDYCAEEVQRRSRKPDVVLLDSRAGIHDVAAVAITQLSDLSLLFGIDNAQTWNGYRELFRQWNADPQATRDVRGRLKMVAATVPAATEDAYLAAFRDQAQLLFSEFLYDQADAADTEAFNPPLSDSEAPHAPLPILFSTDLVGLDSSSGTDWLHQEFVTAAFGEFVRGASGLILGEYGEVR